MIENVEKLSAETKPYSLGQVKLPLQSDIRLPRSKTSQNIAPEITLCSRWRCGKSCAIKNLATGKLRAMNLQRNARV